PISAQNIDGSGPGDSELTAVAEAVDGSLWVGERTRKGDEVDGSLRRYDAEALELAGELPQGGEVVDVAFAGGRGVAVRAGGAGDGLWLRAFSGAGEPIWSYEQVDPAGASGVALAIDEARGEVVALGVLAEGLWLGRFGWDGDV